VAVLRTKMASHFGGENTSLAGPGLNGMGFAVSVARRCGLFPNGARGPDLEFSWGYGYAAEVAPYRVPADRSLDMIGNEKPHAFSGAILDAHLCAQTRSRYHVDRVELPQGLPVPLAHLLVFLAGSVYSGWNCLSGSRVQPVGHVHLARDKDVTFRAQMARFTTKDDKILG